MQKRRPTPPRISEQKIKAYGYVRVSTEEQAKEGISVDAQVEKIRAYASIKNLDLVEIIRDEGYSGKDTNRPGLQHLLSLIQGPEPEALIVYKLDRLTRNTRDLLHLAEDVFKRTETRFLSISEEIDTQTAMGKFFLTIMGAMAQMEREVIAERTQTALQFKKEQGHVLGHVPYGKTKKNEKLIPNAEEIKVIRNIKRWRKDGMSYKQIAARLNQLEIPTRKKNAQWHDSSVRCILNRTSRSQHDK